MHVRFKDQALRLGLLATALTLSTPAMAQVAPPNAGQVLRDAQRPVTPPAPAARPTLSVPDEKDPAADPGQKVTLRDLRIEGAAHLPMADLRPLVADLTGREVTLTDLRAGARRITAYYRSQGFVVARAFIPAQDVVDQTLVIQVLEGKLVSSTAVNHSAVHDHVLRAMLDAQNLNGKVIASSTLDRALLLLADLPSVGKVAGKLRPGAEVGASDLVVSVDPGKRYEGLVSIDTHGNRYTGQNRLNAQGALNSPLGLGDRLSGQVTATDESMVYGRLAYDLPIGGHGLRAGAAVSESTYELGQEFANLDAAGTARTAGVYALYPLVRGVNRNIWLTGNLEARRLKDEIASVNTTTRKDATVATLEAYGDTVDALLGGGYTTWRVSGGVGNLSIKSPNALAADQIGPRTDGDYRKLVLSASRLQALTPRTSLRLSVSGQMASKNLDSSEKFVLGGAYGVRAYPQGEGAGDTGWMANVELSRQVLPMLQLAAFYDAGHIEFNKTVYAPGKADLDLRGFGVSAYAERGPINAKVSVAWRSGTDPATTAPDHSPRVWASLGWRF